MISTMLDDVVNSPATAAAVYRVEDGGAMTEGVDVFDYDETENSNDKVDMTHRHTFHLRDRALNFVM